MLSYPTHFEQIVHFDSIRNTIKEFCQTDFGKKEVDKLTCLTDFNEIEYQLQLNWEVVQCLKYNPTLFPTLLLNDITPLLHKLTIEDAFLYEPELLQITHISGCIISIEEILEHLDITIFPLLSQFNQHLKQYAININDIILSVITPTGDLSESASPELKHIRQQIYTLQKTIDRTLQRILQQSKTDGIISENTLPTIRDGRFVIPIVSANKKKIKGIVLDESDTGKTSFIEPQEITQANNEFRSLKWQEYRERLRILRNIAKKLQPFTEFLTNCQNYIGRFDFIIAKSRLARLIKAQMPTLKNEFVLLWNEVYSPLLLLKYDGEQKKVIPFNIKLDVSAQRIMIISGPNAGGKSVCLKTIALIQYMTQCGILPPICESSTMGIFNKIMVDIGDEQSINDDLSTYSAHLKNMNRMIKNASGGLLFFIDEAGSGTEPAYGGAIAENILTELSHTQAMGVVTTHFSNIKMLATHNSVFINAAMLFDMTSLQPLYKLEIGKPGNSYAIEIAQKIGMPQQLLEKAKESIGKDKVDYDTLMEELLQEKKILQEEKEKYENEQKQLSKLISHYQTQNDNLKAKKQTIIEEAQQQAHDLLKNSNALIEKTIREIKESQAEKKHTNQARQQIQKLKTIIPQPTQNKEQTLKKGQVFHDFKDLKPNTVRPTTKQEHSLATSIRTRQIHFNPTIDLRGMKADEALQTFMNYLDDAIMVNAQHICIIHGTGTGALKQVIRSYLHQINTTRQKNDRDPLLYSDGDINMGGAGITIVNIP